MWEFQHWKNNYPKSYCILTEIKIKPVCWIHLNQNITHSLSSKSVILVKRNCTLPKKNIPQTSLHMLTRPTICNVSNRAMMLWSEVKLFYCFPGFDGGQFEYFGIQEEDVEETQCVSKMHRRRLNGDLTCGLDGSLRKEGADLRRWKTYLNPYIAFLFFFFKLHDLIPIWFFYFFILPPWQLHRNKPLSHMTDSDKHHQ